MLRTSKKNVNTGKKPAISFYTKEKMTCTVCRKPFPREEMLSGSGRMIAGELTDTAKKALFTGLSYANDVLTITIGGTTKTASIHGRRAVNVNGTDVLPISDSAALKFVNGTGISLTWDSKNKNLSVNANTNYSTNDSASKNYAVKTDTN